MLCWKQCTTDGEVEGSSPSRPAIEKNMKLLGKAENLDLLKKIFKKTKLKIPNYFYFYKKNLIKKLISKNQKNKKLHISQFLNKVIKKNIQVKCLPTQNYWYEFDDLSDLKNFSKKIL